jgi:hypothetical protein
LERWITRATSKTGPIFALLKAGLSGDLFSLRSPRKLKKGFPNLVALQSCVLDFGVAEDDLPPIKLVEKADAIVD